MNHSQIFQKTFPDRTHAGRPTIGLLLPNFNDMVSWMVWTGVVAEARAQDVNLLCFAGDYLQNPNGFSSQGNILYQMISPQTVDGLIIWSSVLEVFVSHAEMEAFAHSFHPIPVVSGETRFEGIPAILLDNYAGMCATVQHLIDTHGYRRIAFLRGPAGHAGVQDRYRAYCETLQAAGLPVNERLISPPCPDWDSGAMVLGQMFAERQLVPGRDIDAIVLPSGAMAIQALEMFQKNGIDVPRDIALAGFDDLLAMQTSTPPITTTNPPFPEMGRQAARLLLARLAGESVPDVVNVPAQLIVRQSCGCHSAAMMLAASGLRSSISVGSLERAQVECRDTLCDVMREASGLSVEDRMVVIRLVDAFFTDLTTSAAPEFLTRVEDTLRFCAKNGQEIASWHTAFSLMRRHLLPYLRYDDRILQAEDLWQQARILVAETTLQVQAHAQAQQWFETQTLRQIENQIMTSFDVTQVIDVLAEDLPRLNIPGCYLALYDNPDAYATPHHVPEWSNLMLAYSPQGRMPIPPDGQRFLTRQLLPSGVLSSDAAWALAVKPFYFHEQQLGFGLFMIGPLHGDVYEGLSNIVSAALQGALLVKRVRERSAEISRQKYILDTFMENVPDSIYFKDRESRIIRSNHAHAVLLGMNDPTDLAGKTDFDFFPLEQAQPKYEQEQQILRTGAPSLNQEEPDANGRWSLTTKMPLKDEYGEIIGTFGISRDITPLKQAEAEIRSLNEQLKQENLRMSAELDVARRLQTMVLPSSGELQNITGIELTGFMQPANEVGGDYYDVLSCGDNHLCIGIGDVTGHGLESGVLMLMTQTAIRTLVESDISNPNTFLGTLNRVLYKNIQRMGMEKSLTLSMVRYDAGRLTVIGQHEEVLVIRQDGRIEIVNTTELGFPIGLTEEIGQWVRETTVQLAAGDGIVLYTDGITEAENSNHHMYGLDRLCDVIQANWPQDANTIKHAVIEDVLRHIGTHEVYDDLTLVVLKQQ